MRIRLATISTITKINELRVGSSVDMGRELYRTLGVDDYINFHDELVIFYKHRDIVEVDYLLDFVYTDDDKAEEILNRYGVETNGHPFVRELVHGVKIVNATQRNKEIDPKSLRKATNLVVTNGYLIIDSLGITK